MVAGAPMRSVRRGAIISVAVLLAAAAAIRFGAPAAPPPGARLSAES
jgi:hypothetical protein